MKFKEWKIYKNLKKRFQKRFKKNLFAYHIRSYFLIIFIILALVQIQILVWLNSYHKNLTKVKDIKIEKYKYWLGVSDQFPNIPDILYNTSVSAYNAGDRQKALEQVEKAIRIDPLFKEAIELKKEILEG